MTNRRILITSGPTSVPIDDMRVITNRSTGELGRRIANALAARGARVTFLEGAVTTAVPLNKGIAVRKFYFFDELARLLRSALKKRPAVVVHAAAVSDFRLSRPMRGKAESGQPLVLKLKPTRKLVNDLKRLSPDALLVAFKLEPALVRIHKKTAGIFKQANADLVVANSFSANGYEAFILRPDGSATRRVKSRKELVKVLVREIDRFL